MQRRHFLASLAGAGLMLPLGASAWAATGSAPSRQKLIVVLLRGAADGLNIVAPVGDPAYAALRPEIGLKPEDGFKLDSLYVMHPALAPLQSWWQAGKLAFVHASGSPDITRSHFDAQDYMESGTPGVKTTQDGWLNRLATALPGADTPNRILSVGPVMPRIVAGGTPAMNLPNGAAATRPTPLDRPAIGNAFDALYAQNARLGKTYRDGKTAHQEVLAAAAGMATAEMQAADRGAPLPNGFPDDAARLAGLMRQDARIQFGFFALGGWDTHANQGAGTGQLAQRLAPLAQGLDVLARRLGPLFQDTAIVVMSEFGRTARQNGNAGTDHGHGNVMWLLGGGIQGGKVHGEFPGLDSNALYEGRDLAVTTDFRLVLAQLASRHLQLPDAALARVFPQLPSGNVPEIWRSV
ncbi:DUF1501 domain-containing protein [Massilia sp. TS11]|uniref:DUF1501 domain-containing protein n=1 Tax=Massilia sp. TS11 TaxID=2908003 RepID=UPI001EDC01EC|nr:DUF1501 domain-containing protein [Massilia sp. TS11]MCG2583678.1 DUF1501 domain-containing protein [Massilia sp. TS11]